MRRRMRTRGNVGRGNREMLSLGSYNLPTQSTNTTELVGKPQRPFRPDYLIVTANKSGGNGITTIVVVDIKIGSQSQLVGSEVLPQEMFDPSAFDAMPDDFEVIDSGLHAIVTIRNDDQVALEPDTTGAAAFKGATLA